MFNRILKIHAIVGVKTFHVLGNVFTFPYNGSQHGWLPVVAQVGKIRQCSRFLCFLIPVRRGPWPIPPRRALPAAMRILQYGLNLMLDHYQPPRTSLTCSRLWWCNAPRKRVVTIHMCERPWQNPVLAQDTCSGSGRFCLNNPIEHITMIRIWLPWPNKIWQACHRCVFTSESSATQSQPLTHDRILLMTLPRSFSSSSLQMASAPRANHSGLLVQLTWQIRPMSHHHGLPTQLNKHRSCRSAKVSLRAWRESQSLIVLH